MFEINRAHRKVNLTALVDVVFLLLIFFMLTTNFSSNNAILLDIPAKVGKSNQSWKGAVMLRPNDKDKVLVNAKMVAMDQLEERLKPLLGVSPNKKVIIKPYDNVKLEKLVLVMDKARASGALSLSLIK